MRALLIILLLVSPSLAFADAPSEVELLKGVEGMEMPGLDKRMKARASEALHGGKLAKRDLPNHKVINGKRIARLNIQRER